jgi:hypothetical protein
MVMRVLIIITSRRDNHDVTNTISQTSLAVSIIIVGLHNIEDIGLTIAIKRCLHNGSVQK